MVGEPLCDVRSPILSPNKFTYGRLMKIKGLATNVTVVRAPERAEHSIFWVMLAGPFFCESFRLYFNAILGVILAERCFSQFRPYLWSGGHFVM